MIQQSAMSRDLHRHFSDRLKVLLRDTVETCLEADLTHKDIMSILLSGLLGEAINGAIAMNIPEKEYLALCRMAYRKIKKEPY